MAEWLAAAVEWIAGWWPIRIVSDWETGVRVRGGQISNTLTSKNGWQGQGIHVFVPGWEQIIVEETNIQVIETDHQTVNGQTFSLGVEYRVRDLAAMYHKIHDQDDTISGKVRMAAADVVIMLQAPMKTSEDLEMFGELVLERVKKTTYGWGLEVLRVQVINLVEAQTLRVLTDSD